MAADFGNAGNLTVRKQKEWIQLRVSQGEHLHFKLKARGAQPIFNLVWGTQVLWSEQNYPAGTSQFERTWPRSASEHGANPNDLSVAMGFLTASSYTLVVEIQDSSHRVLSVVTDIDCSSDDPSDSYQEAITVQVA